MLYAAGGGFPMGLADPSAINLNNSESRSRFVFATNATPAKGLSGTSVVTYDAATRTVVSLGTLPGSSDFGTNTVVSTMVPSPSGLMMGGYVSALSGSTIQSSTLKLFTVNLGSANSLQFTTSVK
jgi:hypothetical protein